MLIWLDTCLISCDGFLQSLWCAACCCLVWASHSHEPLCVWIHASLGQSCQMSCMPVLVPPLPESGRRGRMCMLCGAELCKSTGLRMLKLMVAPA